MKFLPARIRYLSAGALGVLLAFGLGTFGERLLGSTDMLQKVTIARTGGIPTSFFWIAEEKGYFRDEGLDVSYLDFDMGQPALDALREGRADITASGELPIVRSILNGDQISILAELESDSGTNIIGRADRGIRTPEDFAGKRVGVTFGTVNEFQLISLLEAHDVSEDQVTFVDVPFADAREALLSGSVDAVSARQSTIARLEQELGERGVVFKTEDVYTFRFLLMANQDFIQRQPATVESVVRALVRAEEFARNEEEEAKAITARRMGVPPEIIADAWDRYNFSMNISQQIFLTLEGEARWLIARESSALAAIPNFLEYMYFDALEAVKPHAVTVPH